MSFKAGVQFIHLFPNIADPCSKRRYAGFKSIRKRVHERSADPLHRILLKLEGGAHSFRQCFDMVLQALVHFRHRHLHGADRISKTGYPACHSLNEPVCESRGHPLHAFFLHLHRPGQVRIQGLLDVVKRGDQIASHDNLYGVFQSRQQHIIHHRIKLFHYFLSRRTVSITISLCCLQKQCNFSLGYRKDPVEGPDKPVVFRFGAEIHSLIQHSKYQKAYAKQHEKDAAQSQRINRSLRLCKKRHANRQYKSCCAQH